MQFRYCEWSTAGALLANPKLVVQNDALQVAVSHQFDQISLQTVQLAERVQRGGLRHSVVRFQVDDLRRWRHFVG